MTVSAGSVAARAHSGPARGPRLGVRHIYVFPTAGGVSYLIVTGLVLLGGINYNNAMAYAQSFLLGAVFLVAIWYTWRNLAGLGTLGANADPVFAGQDAVFRICVDNRAGGERLSLRLRPCAKSARRWRKRAGGIPEDVRFDLPAGAIREVSVHVPTRHRGVLRCPRVLLWGAAPLGLIRAWAYLEPDAACLVYPAPFGRFDLPVSSPTERDGVQPYGAGVEDFIGLRDYQPGDPPRSIAWKVLARNDQLEIKRFGGRGEHSLQLRWELVDALPVVEQRLGQLCRWALEANRRGVAYGLELPGCVIHPGIGARHMADCLRALAEFRS